MARKYIKQHEAFASAVAAGLKPAAAYVAAGYSPKHAQQNSFGLMQKPHIQEMIRELRQAAMAKVAEQQMIKDQAFRTEQLARQDEFKGRVTTIARWVDHVLNMIDECKEQSDMTNCRGFTEMIAKHLGAYEADNRQKPAPQQLINVQIDLDTSPKKASEIYTDYIKNVG